MKEILFLVHRIPFPPNKGCKLRAWRMLKAIVRRGYTVHLGAFIDDPADRVHVQTVAELCGETRFQMLDPKNARIMSAIGLLTGEPLSLPYYRSSGFQAWVDGILARESVVGAAVYSSAMAQFLMNPAAEGKRRIIDFVDVDSEKWRQYGEESAWPMSWIYRRESARLLAYDRKVAQTFDAAFFATQSEADLFRGLAPESVERVDYYNNGVDLDYFDPIEKRPDPYENAAKTMLFTGAMDYRPNVDAVVWFVREALPLILKEEPEARLTIVGGHPAPEVLALAGPAVEVTGRVEDVRPYMAHARFAIAPLRIARGVQNKVLEARAMGLPVLATPEALEGIEPHPGLEALELSTPEAFAKMALRGLKKKFDTAWGGMGRAYIARDYDWNQNLERFTRALDGL